MEQYLPELSGDDQTNSRTKHHRAVVSALMETRGDKLRDAARVVFPDGSEQEGSIWRLRAGWYSALVESVWWLLEFPEGGDAERDRADIERWVVKRAREGYAMLAPSF